MQATLLPYQVTLLPYQVTLLLYQKEMQILPSPQWPNYQHHIKTTGGRCGLDFGHISRLPSSCQAGYLAAVTLHELSGVA